LQVHDAESEIRGLAATIRSRGTELSTLAERLRTPEIIEAFDPWNADAWCRSVAGDSLVRLRQLTEQSFHVLETLGLVAVARYIFELSLWLRLFSLNRDYGFVYYDQLITTQMRFHKDSLAQLEREAAWLKNLGDREAAAVRETFSGRVSPAEVPDAMRGITNMIDAEAARRFSIYTDEAKHNGYAFQAHLIETKAVPPLQGMLRELAKAREEFEQRVGERIEGIRPKRWQWRHVAETAGRVDEYDYLYSFASKLLHATPASITTDQKNLEAVEMRLFLRFVDVTMRDVLELAAEYVP
jgi:hypothetical protein